MSENKSLLDSSVPRPALWRAYFELTRLHKFPLGTLVVFWPCAFGLTMAARATVLPPAQLAYLTAAFFLGSTILHSAACVLNDICDRDFDRLVERTKTRPLASGAVSVQDATIFLLAHCGAVLSLLATASPLVVKVGLASVPLHGLYPLMKRWTYWPQAWLGLAINWSAIIAWITVAGAMQWTAVPLLFAGTWCWTMVYDTIYACQDAKDDAAAGVKSTALLFGIYVRGVLTIFAVGFVAALAGVGIANMQGPAFFVLAVGGAAVHLAWQLRTLDVASPADCGRKFASNGTLGAIVWAGLLLDYWLAVVR